MIYGFTRAIAFTRNDINWDDVTHWTWVGWWLLAVGLVVFIGWQVRRHRQARQRDTSPTVFHDIPIPSEEEGRVDEPVLDDDEDLTALDEDHIPPRLKPSRQQEIKDIGYYGSKDQDRAVDLAHMEKEEAALGWQVEHTEYNKAMYYKNGQFGHHALGSSGLDLDAPLAPPDPAKAHDTDPNGLKAVQPIRSKSVSDPEEAVFLKTVTQANQAFAARRWKEAVHLYAVASAIAPLPEDARQRQAQARKQAGAQ